MTWTRITRGRVGTVFCLLPCILHAREVQPLAVWAEIAVMLGIIAKLSGSEIGPLVFPVRQGNIGADASKELASFVPSPRMLIEPSQERDG
jgi:hypothetical protein